jgi:hypothetical protein
MAQKTVIERLVIDNAFECDTMLQASAKASWGSGSLAIQSLCESKRKASELVVVLFAAARYDEEVSSASTFDRASLSLTAEAADMLKRDDAEFHNKFGFAMKARACVCVCVCLRRRRASSFVSY